MDKSTRFAMIGSFAALLACHSGLCVMAAPPTPEAEQPATEYQNWVDRYARKNLTGRPIDGVPHQLKIVITTVTGDDKVRDELQFGTGITVSGTEVSSQGHVSYFSRDDFSAKGSSGGDPIPEAEMKRLDALLSKLPADDSRLPPAGRRMMIQATVAGDSVVRVYDRANAPDVVWEFLRLSRCGIGSWLPEFQPDSELEVDRYQHGGFFCIAPDHTQLLFASTNDPLQIWEPNTHEFLAEIRIPGILWKDLAFSPDGKLAAAVGDDCHVMDTSTWKRLHKLEPPPPAERKYYSFANPQFIQDGRYLLLQTNEPALWVFDVQTWERVETFAGIPENAIQYIPSPSGKLAVVRSREEVISLWDATQHAEIARLDPGAWLSNVSFSPDEKLLALATTKGNSWQFPGIRVWNTSTGELVHQLRPHEQSLDKVEGLDWSPNGRYVLAVTKPSSFWTSRCVSVFNIDCGRHRGNFVGPLTNVKGFGLLPELGQLVAGSNDGKIYFWDWEHGMKQIAEFEASLENVAADGTEQR